MPSPRRGLLARLGVRNGHHSTTASRYLQSGADRFDFRIADSDVSSICTYLPPYDRATETYHRPSSPTPSYHTIDERRRPRNNFASIVHHKTAQINKHNQQLIDELIIRLRENLKNPNSWRAHKDGKRSFFWALKCSEGTADILCENLDEIRDRVLVNQDWRVEKFCLVFKGQKLEDLWCRPVITEVFASHVLS